MIAYDEKLIIIWNFRGTEDVYSAHGIPMDLLHRLLIIRTLPYNKNDMESIIKLRAQTEGINVNPDALQLLADIGDRSTLRWEIQFRKLWYSIISVY